MEVRQANDTMGAQVRDVAQRTGLVAVNLAMASDMAVHRCRVEDTFQQPLRADVQEDELHTRGKAAKRPEDREGDKEEARRQQERDDQNRPRPPP